MLRNYLTFLTFICLLSSPVAVFAVSPETHSAYKVTTYSLGNITDFESATSVNLRDYDPLLITGNAADVLANNNTKLLLKENSVRDGVQGFAISARFEASKNFAVKGAFGMAHNTWLNDVQSENKSSWEANLGVIYSFFPNLNYELHLGYMDTGDLFKDRNEYSDVESIIMISNKLTMSF